MKALGPVVLLVEDNDDHAELVRRQLEEAQEAVRVVHVRDGEAALHYLRGVAPFGDRQLFPLPHFVLLDLRLPRVDGLEVLREIKAARELKAIPVIVLTTSEGERDMAAAYACQASCYLTKPVEAARLVALLRDLGISFPDGQRAAG